MRGFLPIFNLVCAAVAGMGSLVWVKFAFQATENSTTWLCAALASVAFVAFVLNMGLVLKSIKQAEVKGQQSKK